MKIQHIRKNNLFVGTLVAVKDELTNKVKIGFSVVMKCDQVTQSFSKKRGVEIALNRALTQQHNKVPKKIEEEFREFVTHCAKVRAFSGFEVPSAEDFVYTVDPIHQHKKKK